MKKIQRFTYIFLAASILLSCATTKSKSDVKGFKKFYHNTTAKFNGYFNAEELMDESLVQLQEMNVDNYNDILEVYDYVAIDNPQAVKANMDKAIEKVSTVATIHDVSNYVDDCYLLIGKAQYLKQDYAAAEETFQYFEEAFDPKNPYGKAYDSKSRKKTTGRKSKKEIKDARKEKENEKKLKEEEREAKKKEKEELRKEAEKEKDRKAKERKQAAKDRKKKSKSSKGKKSREERDSNRAAEETSKNETQKEMSDSPATVVKKEVKPIVDEEKLAEEKRKKELEAEKEKQKKKEEEKYRNQGEGAIFKNKSAYTEGLFWLGRTYIETERFSSAEYMLNQLEDVPGLDKDISRQIPAAKAHLYLRTKEYGLAIEALEEAIEVTKNRNVRARYAFILAQLYEKSNDNSRAYAEYSRAKKFSTVYELDFNAGLNELKMAYSEKSISKEKALNKLDNMLSERKNKNFTDQIYFTKAQIKLGDGDLEGSIADFELALGATGGNKNVKLEAYYKLAELLFDKGLYAESKKNYDSVLEIMNKSDDRYKSVERLSNNLTDVADNIQVIEMQDSLLKLSALSEDELREIAVKIIETQAEDLKNNPDPDNTLQRKSNIITSNRQLGAGRSNFFAYNPITLNQGKVEFSRVWGDRVLEDNWRRSLRSNARLSSDDIVNIVEEKEEEISEDQIREILRDIPRNEMQLASSNKKIQNALFQLGILFRERIRNYKKSIEVLERLTNDYPDYEKRDEALFYLYLSYSELEDVSKAKAIIAQMRQEYPESKFTKLATDPEYAQALRDKEDSIEKYYDTTYSLFEEGDYQKVIERINEKDKLYNRSKTYAAKFSLLNAMSLGSISGKDEYVNALNQVIKSYPNSPEEARAKEILRFLKGDQDAFNNILFEEDLQNFENEPDKLHYVFVVTYGLDQKVFDDTKVEILNYNKKFHRFDNLKISNIYLNQQNQARIILIRSFDNKEKSMNYYQGVQKNKNLFIKDGGIGYDIFPVTQKNYREVIKQKTILNYRAFFEQNYLEKKD